MLPPYGGPHRRVVEVVRVGVPAAERHLHEPDVVFHEPAAGTLFTEMEGMLIGDILSCSLSSESPLGPSLGHEYLDRSRGKS